MALDLPSYLLGKSKGGSGGTSDYSQLTNKPSINGVTLSGNKTSEDLGISSDIETITEDTKIYDLESGIYNVNANVKLYYNGNNDGFYDKYPYTIYVCDESSNNFKGYIAFLPYNPYMVSQGNDTDLGYHKVIVGGNAATNNNGGMTMFYIDTTYEKTRNKVTSILSSSTNNQYPSAKAVYDYVNASIASAGSSSGVVVTDSNKTDSDILAKLNEEYNKYLNNEAYNIYYEFTMSNSKYRVPIYINKISGNYGYCDSCFIGTQRQAGGQKWFYVDVIMQLTDNEITSFSPTVKNYTNDILLKNNTAGYSVTNDAQPAHKLYVDKTHYENMAGYDATKTQVLKNINGTLTWVDE